MNITRPSHVYIGRLPCGCCVALVNDRKDQFTGQAVARYIEDGLAVSRVTWEVYKTEVSQEPTFMACSHQSKEKRR